MLLDGLWYTDGSGTDRQGCRVRRSPNPADDPLGRLARMLTEHHLCTARHSRRVSRFALATAEVYGMDRGQRSLLLAAADLHDVGKLCYPVWLLDKPAALSPEEYTWMQAHSSVGGCLLRAAGAGQALVAAVRSHHEYFDGAGYPDGLRGEEIPLFARVLAVADSFDAMTAARPYRLSLKAPEARENLRRGAGSQFDPQVVAAFLERAHLLPERGRAGEG